MRTIVDLNIEGTLAMTHAVLPQRDAGSTFRAITVSSLAAFFPMPVKATYAASKRFLVDFSLALREELKPLGATVTVLCPAGLPTAASTIEAIEAQGFMGHITTKNVGYVASKTLDQAVNGKPIVIPGVLNQALRVIGTLLPARWISAFVGKRWRKAHRRRVSAAGLTVTNQARVQPINAERSPGLRGSAAA
jgi:short-subunit dehydrogenase